MKTWPLLFFSLLSASAQTMTTGTIVGDVTDAARAVVRGATVSLDFPSPISLQLLHRVWLC